MPYSALFVKGMYFIKFICWRKTSYAWYKVSLRPYPPTPNGLVKRIFFWIWLSAWNRIPPSPKMNFMNISLFSIFWKLATLVHYPWRVWCILIFLSVEAKKSFKWSKVSLWLMETPNVLGVKHLIFIILHFFIKYNPSPTPQNWNIRAFYLKQDKHSSLVVRFINNWAIKFLNSQCYKTFCFVGDAKNKLECLSLVWYLWVRPEACFKHWALERYSTLSTLALLKTQDWVVLGRKWQTL